MDQELKQRLIGASVIIALAIIFVPMLFDGEVQQNQNQNISIQIPEAGENNLEVKKFELDKPVAATNDLPPPEQELVIDEQQPVLVDSNQANPVQDTIQDQGDQPENAQNDTQAAVQNNQPVVEQPSVTTETSNPNTSQQAAEPADEPAVNTVVEAAPSNQPVANDPPPQSNVSSNQATGGQAYRVKLGSFSQQANAERVKSTLLQNNIKAMVEFNAGLKL